MITYTLSLLCWAFYNFSSPDDAFKLVIPFLCGPCSKHVAICRLGTCENMNLVKGPSIPFQGGGWIWQSKRFPGFQMNTGLPFFIAHCFIMLLGVEFITNWRQDSPLGKRWYLALLRCLPYCNGLELNSQMFLRCGCATSFCWGGGVMPSSHVSIGCLWESRSW